MALGFAYNDPTLGGGSTGLDLYTWIMTNLLFEGTMRGLFSLLFGVGMFILIDGLERKGAGIEAANIYFRRLSWLLVFGLIHGYLLLWIGEILYNYALMGFLVFSFRKLAPLRLVVIALAMFCAGALWSYFDYLDEKKLTTQAQEAQILKADGKTLSDELKKADEKWQERIIQKTPESINEENLKMRKGYVDVMVHLGSTFRHFNEHDPYRLDVWDILAVMLIGIALYKWNVLGADKSFGFYGLIALAGYSIGFVVNYFEVTSIMKGNFSMLAFSKANITYDLGRIPMALGHVAMIMIFCKANILMWLKRALAAVGQMALTNYVMHSVFSLVLFTGAGFGLFGKLHRHELLYVVVSIWVFQLIVSPIWLRYFLFGPLEWIWRNLSYNKRHPFRRASANE